MAIESFDQSGNVREDWRAAQIACILYNANRDKNSVAKGLTDFMWEQPEVREQSAAEQRRIMGEFLIVSRGSE